jgi:cyclophilin family peptidyl-prolyl cis-trans isomerase
MKKTAIVICICIMSAISFLTGCVNIPKELTQFSIVSFDVEPGIINQGESANLSWAVLSASSVSIDNGIGNVALTGHRTIQPMHTTTYILTATNATVTKNATVTITVNNESNGSHENQEIIISSFKVTPSVINQGESANLSWTVTGATSVKIDNGIGNVSLTGIRIVMPTVTTTYLLTASNNETIKTTTTQIIVKNNKNTSDNRIAVISTSMGTLRVELYEDKMPTTTANFIRLANDGFYNGLIFHRVINHFMIQGGGFFPNGTYKTDPYGTINLEINRAVHHVDGTIAMARTTDPNSATSQFFIDDGAQPQLEPGGVDAHGYAAFGVVVGNDSFTVLRNIAAVQTTTKHGMQDWPVNEVIINSITIINS